MVRGRAEGSIELLPSGRYRVRVYAGRDALTGRQMYLRATARTKPEAKAELARLLNQLHERRQPRAAITMAQAIDQWLGVVRHEASTRERNEQLIRLYILPTLGKKPVHKITAEGLEILYSRLLRCRSLCSDRPQAGHTCEPLAPNTVRKVHFIIRSVLDRAVRWKFLSINEAELAEPPAFHRNEPDPPSAEEARALLAEASRDPDWALLLFLTMLLGWRRGELCALRWTDINLDDGLITIERSHWGNVEKRTKTNQTRRVALDQNSIEQLQDLRARRQAACASIGVAWSRDSFVFSRAPDGSSPLTPSSVTQRYRKLARKLGLRSTRLHSLRHYSATELIAANVDVRTVAGRLGHGSGGTTTLRTYAGWSADADRRAAEKIAALIPRPEPALRRPQSPYEQLAADLRNSILSGALPAGTQLPTLAELAAEHNMAPNTVARAIAMLKDEGLLSAERGRRAVVLATEEPRTRPDATSFSPGTSDQGRVPTSGL
ncbi:site-specific integrase [Sporichthya brevicatena]|uniref:Site-specific integrase n=1 Tax=Sporichthya brevicatena TaxID=171442 RepID=A0ABN1G448_9ACTN